MNPSTGNNDKTWKKFKNNNDLKALEKDKTSTTKNPIERPKGSRN